MLNLINSHIKLLASFLLLTIFNSNSFCQTKEPIKKDFLQIHLNLWDFDFGQLNSKSSGALREESKFILDDLSGFLMGFSPEIQFVFVEKIGIIVGYELFGSPSSETETRSTFPLFFTEHKATFKDNDYEKQIYPITQSKSYAGPKLGISYQINFSKFKIIPFTYVTFDKGNDFPKLEIDLVSDENNISTSRKYYFSGDKNNIFTAGCELRIIEKWQFGFANIGIVPKFRWFQSTGISSFDELNLDGNIIQTDTKSFEQITSTFSLSIKCGFQIRFKNKKMHNNIYSK